MTEPEQTLPEQMLELADAQCSGIITESEMETLERLLTDFPELRGQYLNFVFLHIGLAGTASTRIMSAHDSPFTPNVIEPAEQQTARPAESRLFRRSLVTAVCLVTCLCALELYLFFPVDQQPTTPTQIAESHPQYYFDENTTPPEEVATLHDAMQATWELLGKHPAVTDHFQPGTVKLTSGNVDFAFSGGADISLASPALFGMEHKNQGTLFSGSLSTHKTDSKAPFTLETPSVELIDRGTEYEVSVNEAAETFVHVLDGQVEVKARGHLPRFFWNFDQPEMQPLTDSIVGSPIRAGKNAKRISGLIGKGAVRFNNRPDASLLAGNGGGTDVGTGDYSVSTGITLEALVLSEWQTTESHQKKTPFDYDEIFRKEDGSYRILLSFQNDDNAGQTQIPSVEKGPCLSFGLYLSGVGYNEMDLPLDGKAGRPTLEELRDGKPHHIAATYNSWTGVKAIYIDGVRRMSHQFPVGTMIISGGPTPAVIGNLISGQGESLIGREPFNGVIDEVAFYDFALDAATIATHFARVQAGKDYFDGQLKQFILQAKQGGNVLLNKGQKMKFAAETGLPIF
ncbi:LamG-like jellyroll fold domain-containing protein [uncultured Gimesia sp.]|uniref:LamG-like jellyroll fold domain-containing protein n=1 Tax=uncultured Gimesia sp. TaxID=1678688 RepID=UPI0026121E6D|nr:LamG-like jellyroll fold domain-containing protein [uncultured Gimesia sp.]